ncbi:MAG: 30S ribosomal protein S1 [Elusimicrobia bacterium GWA2_61_42]|nr:MAG: 30S ribosomal protein S1 [Elusimicrobia bacterium GWA2_61_42]OGR76580.1 MAG: 30S ribosomal protein S1 [Elusimicrobia bacterium GWC2_61_25]
MHTNDQHNTAENEENFAEMFEQAYKEPSRMEPGQKIEAAIVKMTPEWALIEVGGKGEGYVDINELKDAEGNLLVKEGDKIRAYFVRSEEGEMRFTTRIGSGPAARAQIADAFKNHIPLEGVVAREVKGGFEITIGAARAFCPFSQMGARREDNKADYIGKTLLFDIIECGERNVVLSRRAIIEAERREKAAALKETLKEGDKIKGVVTSIQKFGAFVDIGGIEGLLPVSEIAWSRTENVGDILKVGQPVEVMIKRLDWQNERISFSLKDVLANPWDTAAMNWPPGSYHTGTVTRLAPFGAFISMGDGVDGLIHISRLGGDRRIGHPEEVLKVGQTIEVRVDSVDPENRKLSLVPASISRAEDETSATMDKYRGKSEAAPQELGSMGEMLKKALENKEK